jgi:hypothetical protein
MAKETLLNKAIPENLGHQFLNEAIVPVLSIPKFLNLMEFYCQVILLLYYLLSIIILVFIIIFVII